MSGDTWRTYTAMSRTRAAIALGFAEDVAPTAYELRREALVYLLDDGRWDYGRNEAALVALGVAPDEIEGAMNP